MLPIGDLSIKIAADQPIRLAAGLGAGEDDVGDIIRLHLKQGDLADLVVGPPMFAKAKLPKFLRPHEVRRLFDHLPYGTGRELRTCKNG